MIGAASSGPRDDGWERIMMPRSTARFGSISAALLMLVGPIHSATANDRGVRGISVPASACKLFQGTAHVGGSGWVVRFGEGADLICPLPLNNVDLGGTADHNHITSFRVYYQDPDKEGNDALVSVNLLRFKRKNGVLISDTLCSFVSGPAPAVTNIATVPCDVDLAGGGVFYNFVVGLSPGASSGPGPLTSIRGIDFP
jgi:hypothetical protein